MSKEITFYNSNRVAVTSARVMFDGHVLAIANIASVRHDETSADRKPVLICFAFAATLIYLGVETSASYLLLVGLALGFAGFVLAKRTRPTIHVLINDSSGRQTRISSQDRTHAYAIVSAIHSAIAQR